MPPCTCVHAPEQHGGSWGCRVHNLFSGWRCPCSWDGKTMEAPKYLPWDSSGGPNECAHGYAAGIPCPSCDGVR